MAVENFYSGERSGFFGSQPMNMNEHFSNFGSGVTLNNLAQMIRAQQTCCYNILAENKKLGDNVLSLQQTVGKLQSDILEMHTFISSTVLSNKAATLTPKSRLPKTLTVAVKRLHQSLENQFDGTKLFSDKYNQEVAEVLTAKLTNEFEEDVKIDLQVIRKAVHRHFESRRRMFNDSQPHRLSIKESNDKKTKLCNRQKQLYSRRLKHCKTETEKSTG